MSGLACKPDGTPADLPHDLAHTPSYQLCNAVALLVAPPM